MSFLAVKKLRWNEPEAYREQTDQVVAEYWTRLWWLRPLTVLALSSAAALIGWFDKVVLHKDTPAGSPYGFGIAAAGVVFLFYGTPWLLRQLPASVTLYSTGIMKMGDKNLHSFKGMVGYAWQEKPTYCVLLIATKKGRRLSYGVPDSITKTKIDEVLRRNGLMESPS